MKIASQRVLKYLIGAVVALTIADVVFPFIYVSLVGTQKIQPTYIPTGPVGMSSEERMVFGVFIPLTIITFLIVLFWIVLLHKDLKIMFKDFPFKSFSIVFGLILPIFNIYVFWLFVKSIIIRLNSSSVDCQKYAYQIKHRLHILYIVFFSSGLGSIAIENYLGSISCFLSGWAISVLLNSIFIGLVLSINKAVQVKVEELSVN